MENTIVLSMKSEIKRRCHINEQLSRLNVKYEFFDAITPVDVINIEQYKSDLTKGEKCCALSHLSIYKKIIEGDSSSCIILEDDAHIVENVFVLKDDFEEIHKNYDVIILGYSKVNLKLMKYIQFIRPLFKIINKNGKGYGIPYVQWKCGTVAYSISKVGANKIIGINEKVKYTADDWNSFENKGLSICHLMPIAVIEDLDNFESSLESDRNTNKNRSLYLRLIAGFFRHFKLFKTYISFKLN